MAFSITPNVHVRRDQNGLVRHLRHIQEPFTPPPGLAQPTPAGLASSYVRDVAEIYSIDDSWLEGLDQAPKAEATSEESRLRRAHQKKIQETTVVSYVQTYLGLPIWEAGLSVTVHDNPTRATSSLSTVHHEVKLDLPDNWERSFRGKLSIAEAGKALKLAQKKRPKIHSERLLVYRFDPGARVDPESDPGTGRRKKPAPLEASPPTLPLPPLPKTIKGGHHYLVREILFDLPVAGRRRLNWRAFIEVRTGAVLYLRAFTTGAFGNIFPVDPVTVDDTLVGACSPAADLDPYASVVTLPGLTPPADPADPQELTGEFVEIDDFNSPTVAPPTDAGGNFSYSAITDDFSAVNAYYHVDWLFRLMEDMGFTLSDFFDNTVFPIPVDHRGKGSAVNAHCDGNAGGDGVGEFAFGLVEAGCPVGIAAAKRVVIHEFGHAILWDSVHSPNFGFAHSAGDSLAAILCDPGSQAGDRFNSFPWVTGLNPSIDRRHDRDVTAGWAWGGSNDVGGYSSEQILSTTLFRAYRSTGGDASHSNASVQLARREFAARYLSYLIFRATGSLATSPITPTNDPDVFASALMDADTGTTLFEGHPGGAFHKVVRWAFEKQGLYQPAGAPTPVISEGDPPDVDVYIDDGRNGEYQYQHNFWNSQDMWNRLSPDGGLTHETPVTRQTNYMYVRVKNRGTQAANNCTVKAFHCRPAAGLVWPDDWQAMTTAELPASGPIASGGETVLGPFEWTPEVVGHECLLAFASADGDLSNADSASLLPSATGPIPHWRLVPFDNNIGQRNVAPVAGAGGAFGLSGSFERRSFWVNNPYDRAVRIQIEPHLPDFLKRRKWDLGFLNPGGAAFTLGPRASREIIMRLPEGGEFSADDVRAAGSRANIEVLALLENQVIGGMTYPLDPSLHKRPAETPEDAGEPDCSDAARKLLDCLNLPSDEVRCVRVRRITVDIELGDKC